MCLFLLSLVFFVGTAEAGEMNETENAIDDYLQTQRATSAMHLHTSRYFQTRSTQMLILVIFQQN